MTLTRKPTKRSTRRTTRGSKHATLDTLAEFAPVAVSLLKRRRGYTTLTVLDVLVSDLDVMNDGQPRFIAIEV